MLAFLTGGADVCGQDRPQLVIVCSPAQRQARSSSGSASTACVLNMAPPQAPGAGDEGSGQEATSAPDPVRTAAPVLGAPSEHVQPVASVR